MTEVVQARLEQCKLTKISKGDEDCVLYYLAHFTVVFQLIKKSIVQQANTFIAANFVKKPNHNLNDLLPILFHPMSTFFFSVEVFAGHLQQIAGCWDRSPHMLDSWQLWIYQ